MIGKLVGEQPSIKDMDEYCRLYNKRILLSNGNVHGFLPGYYVGKNV